MTITDDIVKGLRNPTPLYAVAGTADLAAEKLREVPGMLDKLREQAPERIGKLRATDPKDVQQRVTEGARDAQTRLNETFSDLDLKELRPDLRKIGESVQGLALQGVGRAAGYAVRTRETYDELAERGKGAVAKWRGGAADTGKESAEIAAKPPAGPADEPAPAAKAKPRSAEAADAPKPAAPRKPAAQRRTTPKKPAE
ncbi:hypothetical protein RVR_5736 [Actinacidiphila reveromycinica]|uniref:Uncharacterized protein n=1 Tax=Actinacidiphila reveromycinica TaxID=659352 RepID=A0A7U3UV71_9ACTN|nr:hypothetical protein [Streptomyces sp. SN-593]BBA99211.1 hypothetical protein RVR_5736 [Streptomyces sp. SN-593]